MWIFKISCQRQQYRLYYETTIWSPGWTGWSFSDKQGRFSSGSVLHGPFVSNWINVAKLLVNVSNNLQMCVMTHKCTHSHTESRSPLLLEWVSSCKLVKQWQIWKYTLSSSKAGFMFMFFDTCGLILWAEYLYLLLPLLLQLKLSFNEITV